MANPTYFTVVADFKSVVVDLDTDVDPDPQLGPVTAKVTFTPVLANGDVILASTASPRPTVFVPAPIVARIDTDGRLKLRVAPDGDRDDYATRASFPATGNAAKIYWAIDTQTFYRWTGSTYAETYPYAQVRLLANTPLLGLASNLFYRVSFSDVVFNGAPGFINSFTFQAPSADLEINLVDVARVPGQPAAGITKGDKGDRGYSFVGLAPAGDGSSVIGLIETPSGVQPAGQPIPISLAYNSTVTHGSTALTARPPVSVAVIWIGSVEPTYAIDGDVWIDTAGSAPTITTTTLGSLNQNAQTSQTLIASGTNPIIWSVSAGTLPAGLTISTEGNLYGSPTATGSYNFTVRALNAFGNNTRQLTGTIGSAIGPTINTTALGTTTSGVSFSLTLSSTGSTPITYAVQSGSLPTGLTLNASTGVISGTPTTVESYSFTIRATNSAGYDDQAFSGSVAGIAPTITTTAINPIYRAFSVSQTLSSSGSATITYAVQSGSLPNGLTLNTSTGVISGTPTTAAAYTFTIRASNSYGTNDKTFTGSVLESTPNIVETALQTMTATVAFSQTLTLSVGGPTITWSVATGTLPAGLSLNATTGTISGSPAGSGSYSFTIRASNGTAYDDQAFTGSVQALAVVFDTAVSGGGADGSGPLSMSVAPSAGAGGILVVGFTANSPSATISATFDGVAMTQIGSTSHVAIYQSYAHLATFKLASAAPGGTKSIQATCSVGGGRSFGQFVSFTNYSSIGSLQTLENSGARSPGSSVIQNVTTQTGHLIVQGYVCSAGFGISSYSKTLRSPANGFFFYAGTAQASATQESITATFDTRNFAFNAIGHAVNVSS
jgi:hypothetical protein